MSRTLKELAGQRFGELVAIERSGKNIRNQILWKCQCDCGNVKLFPTSALDGKHTRSCGCWSRMRDLTGKTFGKWKVISFSHISNTKSGHAYWNCRCECGKESKVAGHSLTQDRSPMCKSCSHKEIGKKLRYPKYDLTGQTFGLLTVKEYVFIPLYKASKGRWKCECACGNITYAIKYQLEYGLHRSCKSCGSKRDIKTRYIEREFGERTKALGTPLRGFKRVMEKTA